MVKHLRESQQHTAISHMNSSSTLVATFFRTTPALETYVNHVKLTMFGVKDGAPILAADHPVHGDLAKPMQAALLMSEANVNVIQISILGTSVPATFAWPV
jgi:hypothetical protein